MVAVERLGERPSENKEFDRRRDLALARVEPE